MNEAIWMYVNNNVVILSADGLDSPRPSNDINKEKRIISMSYNL